jgi:hypothetical protein
MSEKPFAFLSHKEFDTLSSGAKLAYLTDAMIELERAKVPRAVRGWHSLFSQSQQQQQPQNNDDSGPPQTAHWEFVLAEDQTWTWCRMDGSEPCTSVPFAEYGAVIENAISHGFNPTSQNWLVKSDGRTTHFRPGQQFGNRRPGENPRE